MLIKKEALSLISMYFFEYLSLMRLEHYISELLYRYECVTIPEFGSFLTQFQSAKIHESTNAFYPPTKTLSFNAHISTNDGLLAKHIAEVESKSYEQVLADIQLVVKSWEQNLSSKSKIHLDNIGELWLNEENKIQFEPSYRLNYLTSSFGLSSFVSQAVIREQLKEEVIVLETKAPVMFTSEKRTEIKEIISEPPRERRPYLKYAAVILLALSTGLTGYKYLENKRSINSHVAVEEAQKEVENSIQQATFFDSIPMEIPVVNVEVEVDNNSGFKYHIIGGAFRVEANAHKKIRQLRSKGYKAEHVGINAYGLHQVAYGSFSNVDKALAFLRNVKAFENSEAWLWVNQ